MRGCFVSVRIRTHPDFQETVLSRPLYVCVLGVLGRTAYGSLLVGGKNRVM